MWKRSHPDKAKEKMNLGLCVMTCVPIAWIAFVFSFTQPTLYPCKAFILYTGSKYFTYFSPNLYETHILPNTIFVCPVRRPLRNYIWCAGNLLFNYCIFTQTQPHCRIDQHQKFVTSSLWIAATSSMQLRVFSGLHPTHAQTIHEIEVGDNL